MGFPFCVTALFSLTALKIFYPFSVLNIMCLSVDLFGLNLLVALCLLDLDNVFTASGLESFQLLFLQINFLSCFLFSFWDPYDLLHLSCC